MASTRDGIKPNSWCKHMRKGRGSEGKRTYHGSLRMLGKKLCKPIKEVNMCLCSPYNEWKGTGNKAHYCGICSTGDYRKALVRDFPLLFTQGFRTIELKLDYAAWVQFNDLCWSLQNIVDHTNNTGQYTCRVTEPENYLEQCEIVQIKLKFNSLCIYLRGGNEFQRGMCSIAQSLIKI